jgi:hypothetical protein
VGVKAGLGLAAVLATVLASVLITGLVAAFFVCVGAGVGEAAVQPPVHTLKSRLAIRTDKTFFTVNMLPL